MVWAEDFLSFHLLQNSRLTDHPSCSYYFPLQEITREIPRRGNRGNRDSVSNFPQLPDKACPMQAYPGGPLGHLWAHWYQSHGWRGLPDSHVGHGVQDWHPAEGLGDHKDTHCGGGGQERQADLFILFRQKYRNLNCQPHPACYCQNPTQHTTQLKTYKI